MNATTRWHVEAFGNRHIDAKIRTVDPVRSNPAITGDGRLHQHRHGLAGPLERLGRVVDRLG
jgi:hypothetical protein